MTRVIKGKRRLTCEVCGHRVFYVHRAAFPLVGLRQGRPPLGHAVDVPAGALVCDPCVAANGIEAKANPVPLAKTEGRRRRARAQLVIPETRPRTDEGARLFALVREVRSVAHQLARLPTTRHRLLDLSDELMVIAGAVELDLGREEEGALILSAVGGRR